MEHEMKDEFSRLDSYSYTCSDKKESIMFDETEKIVGSKEWAVAASDTGGDWTWSKEPPYNKIKEWFIKHQGIQPNDRRLHLMVKSYQKKILNEGIHSHYWVDKYLADFTHDSGAPGSGMI